MQLLDPNDDWAGVVTFTGQATLEQALDPNLNKAYSTLENITRPQIQGQKNGSNYKNAINKCNDHFEDVGAGSQPSSYEH